MEETLLKFLIEALPGAVGSIVALFYEDNISFRRGVMLVFVGVSVSGFLSPALVEYFQTSETVGGAISFLLARYADGVMKAGKRLVNSTLDKIIGKLLP